MFEKLLRDFELATEKERDTARAALIAAYEAESKRADEWMRSHAEILEKYNWEVRWEKK